jgi:hypothetical protein
MMIWAIVTAVFAAGCVGGLVTSVLAGELQLPKLDPEARVYRPGWLGTVLVGGIAALVFWGLYGPMASAVLLGDTAGSVKVVFRVSELFGALLSGIGGGRLLTSEVEKKLLARQAEVLNRSTTALASAVGNLSQE